MVVSNETVGEVLAAKAVAPQAPHNYEYTLPSRALALLPFRAQTVCARGAVRNSWPLTRALAALSGTGGICVASGLPYRPNTGSASGN
jgi:hypothetical protein